MSKFRLGNYSIELVCLVLVGVTISFFIAPHRASENLRAAERQAVLRMRRIADIERSIFRATSAEKGGRYAFLPEVIENLPDDEKAGFSRKNFVDSRRANSQFIVGVSGGYCFSLYLLEEDGSAVVESQGQPLRNDFWILYAWPERFGKTGRRMFVLDSFGTERFWENSLGRYSGPETPPTAGLARSIGGADYPMRDRVQGWEKSIKWESIEAP